MFTYLKFGLPRVLPPGREETSSDFNSSDEEVATRTSRARTRLRPSRSEEFLDRSRDGQDNRYVSIIFLVIYVSIFRSYSSRNRFDSRDRDRLPR